MFPSRYPCSKSVKVSRLKCVENITYCLLILFSRYGNIVDINIGSHGNFRLDAFILFESSENARNAVFHMQGFRLFGRPMRVRLSTRGDTYFSQLYSNQALPSTCVEYGIYTPSYNPILRALRQENLCSHCRSCSRATSSDNRMNPICNLNDGAGPSSEHNDRHAGPPKRLVPMVPTRYNSVKPLTLVAKNDICLYVSNIPGNDTNATHYVAMSLFKSCIGFETVHMVLHIPGTAVITFGTDVQVRLALSFYDGYKTVNNLHLQIRICSCAIIKYINDPDFNPDTFFI